MLIVPQDEDESFFNGVEPFTVASLLYVIINYLRRPIATATGWKSVCVTFTWRLVFCHVMRTQTKDLIFI